MNTSLDKLVSNLAKAGADSFVNLAKHIEQDTLPLLLRKGVYPYDYMDCKERFNETSLPSKEHFYNELNEENISDADYHHAIQVVTSFNCQTLGDYHNLYLLSDVLLLADVFENFRAVCLQAYNLDPCRFYSYKSWACLASLIKND